MKNLIAVLFSLIALSSFAQDFEYNGIWYTVLNKQAKTCKTRDFNNNSSGNNVSGDIVLPEIVEYNGESYSLTGIGFGSFFNCDAMTSVSIPNTVTSIEKWAFQKCSKLVSISLPNSVISLDDGAFLFCHALTSISIPNTVTYIGEAVFAGCDKLDRIIVENGNQYYTSENGVLFNSDKTILHCYPTAKSTVEIPHSVTTIARGAFFFCSNLTSVILPNSITSIEMDAFNSCSNLSSVNIPSSVTSIGDDAFNACSSLTSVNIPNSVTSIGKEAFRSCSSLTSITLPNSVTSIGSEMFRDCSKLTSADIPNSVTSIGNRAFECCSALTSVNIPSSVTSIGNSAFYGCSSLTSVNIPSSVTSIGNGAFGGCSSLTSVNIPNSVTSIGNNTFNSCSSLTSITIPNSVITIGDNAFENCSSLTSINIPNSVTTIGKFAFFRCSDLEVVNIPNSVTSIGYGAFSGCSNLASVNIPNSVTSIGDYAFDHCDKLENIIVESGNQYFSSENGVLYNYDKTVLIYCPEAKSTIKIPYSVTSISDYAFNACSSLTSVNIPNSVTSIGNSAFNACSSLTSVNIPNSVTSIGDGAFYGCSSLTSVDIPNSVTSIGDRAFSACDKLENIIVQSGNQYFSSENGILYNYDKTVLICCPGAKSAVEIPNYVTFIGNGAFNRCHSLTSVNIPNSVTSIGNSAFNGCSSLTSVNILSSVTSIGKSTFCGCLNLISVTIPNSITSIEDFTFSNCPKLTTIVIPISVTRIGDRAFGGCSSLTSVNIPNSVTSIGDGAFIGCSSLTSVNIPSSVTHIEESAFTFCSNLKNIYYLTENPIEATDIFDEDIFRTGTLHVPESALAKIKSTEPWMNFENIDTQYSEIMSPVFNDAMGNVITIGPNSKSELAPALHAFGPAKGVQFDLTLPKGLLLSDITASGVDNELNGLVASHAKLENGDFRVLIYTNDGEELGNIMLGMSFESDVNLERGTSLCHNIIHSIFDTEVVLDDETAYVTGYDVTLPEVSIEELETFTLPAPLSAVINDVTYRWGEVEPSDVAILSSEGVITAKNRGEAVYSLYVKDGDRPEKKYTALLEVIASLWGDADKDGLVNISDLVAVVSYILERSPENFDTRLADIDHNGRINIVDLTGIVKIILSQQNGEEAIDYSTFAMRQELTFGEAEKIADNRHRIAIEIEPIEEYTAMQTDIRLPEGIKLEALTLGNDLNGHTIEYAEVDALTVRIIIYSPTLAGITPDKKTAIADLILSGEPTEDAVISTGETLACDTDGYAYTLASTEKGLGSTASLSTITTGDYKAIANQGGVELIAPEATVVHITDLSGRCIAESVAPTTVSLEAGIYLVTFENIATTKVIVK